MTPTDTPPRWSAAAPAGVTVAFAATVAMWTLGYALRLPGVEAAPAVTGASLIAILALAALLVGRVTSRALALRTGLVFGATVGLVNLLVLGSLLLNPQDTTETRPGATVIVLGWLGFCVALGALGAIITRRARAVANPNASAGAWLGRFALVAVSAVVSLIVVGGIVTSTESGMAAPDWPTTEGVNMLLYPLSRMTGDIYIEHAHRLFGAFVGLTTITLTIFTLLVDERRGVRALAVAALLFVLFQGFLGGARVELDERALGAVHGVTAQMFLALMAALAAVLSAAWRRTTPAEALVEGARAPRTLAAWTLAALILQTGLGSVARHFQTGPGFVHTLLTHAGFSVVPFVLIIALSARGGAAFAPKTPPERLSRGLLHAALFQMLLGGASLWAVLMHREDEPAVEVILTTAHQANGALLVGISAFVLAWSRRARTPSDATSA